MPIYEFVCSNCSHEFDLLVSMGFSSAVCPKCGSSDCARRLSSFGFSSGGQFQSSASGSDCGGCSKGSCKHCK